MTRATEITENDPARIERVARAIYMTHWHPGAFTERSECIVGYSCGAAE